MTIFETAIAAAVVAVLLYMAAGGVRTIRQQAKRNLCARVMASLREALDRYHDATGAYPPSAVDGSAAPALAALRAVAPSAQTLASLPPSLRLGQDPQTGGVDPWGRPLRYLTADASRPEDREDVTVNDGVPIFESAGADGHFGLDDPAASIDNLRTSDL